MKSKNNYSEGYTNYLKKHKKRKNKSFINSNNIICWNISYMGSPCKLWDNTNIFI